MQFLKWCFSDFSSPDAVVAAFTFAASGLWFYWRGRRSALSNIRQFEAGEKAMESALKTMDTNDLAMAVEDKRVTMTPCIKALLANIASEVDDCADDVEDEAVADGFRDIVYNLEIIAGSKAVEKRDRDNFKKQREGRGGGNSRVS